MAARWPGAVAGAVVILLVAWTGVVSFDPPVHRGGVLDHCTWIGYPKVADYFWYAAAILSAIGGAAGLEWLDRRRRAGVDPAAPEREELPRARRWWPAVSLAIAAVWTLDPGWRARPLDALHEGAHLLYARHALAGEWPGAGIRTEYGPLYTHSLIAWLGVTEMTVEMERRYFHAAQVAGAWLHLLALGWICRSGPVLAIATVAMLGLSTASADLLTYGWASPLRTAFGLLAVVLLWRASVAESRRLAVAAGAAVAAALLYSPEFGLAAVAGCLVLCVLPAGRPLAGRFLLGAAVTGAAIWTILFGRDAVSALGGIGGGYGWARLTGHGARPWPDFRLDALVIQVSLWGPAALVVAGAVALMGGGPVARWPSAAAILALLPVVLLSQLPAIARPHGQQTMSAPFAVVLGALLLDRLRREHRRWAIAAGAAVVGWAAVAPNGNLVTAARRLTAPRVTGAGVNALAPRLGKLALPVRHLAFAVQSAAVVREFCPEGKRVFLAAPYHLIVPFLADRAALAPYPSTELAVLPGAAAVVMAALERDPPPVALVTEMGLDVPYALEHPDQWAFIRSRYRKLRTIGDLDVYVLNGSGARGR